MSNWCGAIHTTTRRSIRWTGDDSKTATGPPGQQRTTIPLVDDDKARCARVPQAQTGRDGPRSKSDKGLVRRWGHSDVPGSDKSSEGGAAPLLYQHRNRSSTERAPANMPTRHAEGAPNRRAGLDNVITGRGRHLEPDRSTIIDMYSSFYGGEQESSLHTLSQDMPVNALEKSIAAYVTRERNEDQRERLRNQGLHQLRYPHARRSMDEPSYRPQVDLAASRNSSSFHGSRRQSSSLELPRNLPMRGSSTSFSSSRGADAWSSLKDIGATLEAGLGAQPLPPAIRSETGAMSVSRRTSQRGIAEAEHSTATANSAGSEIGDPNSRLHQTLFDMWMTLHTETHEKDEARREKYLGKKYCPASKAQENKLLYSKEHHLVAEAFIGNHPLRGEVLDRAYVKCHMMSFSSTFDALYRTAEGSVPWQLLQFFGYLFRHMHLLVQKTIDEADTLAGLYDSAHGDMVVAQKIADRRISELKAANQRLEEDVSQLNDRLTREHAEVARLKEDTRERGAAEDPLAKIRDLTMRLGRAKQENDTLMQRGAEMSRELEAARRQSRGLRADLAREHNLVKMAEDTLPGNSEQATQKLLRLSHILSTEQMTLLRKAVNMGNDPKELYALLMARSLSGADLGPYIPLIGELRSTFDAIHIKSEWNTGALEDGSAEAPVCELTDRPLTKSYLTFLIKRHDAKALKERLSESVVKRISLAVHHGMSPSLLVQLLDGRMSKKGTCMLAYRGLLGALKEHEAFDPDGPSAAALVDASECCSITALIGFKSDKLVLERKLEAANDRIQELQDQIRLRDFKFGHAIGIEKASSKDAMEDAADVEGAEEMWRLSPVTKLDEFLSRDHSLGFRALGLGPDVPKFLRAEGMIENVEMSKKDTEELIADVWSCKEAHDLHKRHLTGLHEYLSIFLPQRFGGHAAKMGYNLVHSCFKYKYDPDCNIFWQVLDGQVSQDIQAEINKAFEKLVIFMQTLDCDLHVVKGATGRLAEAEVMAVVQCVFADKPASEHAALAEALRADVRERSWNPLYIDYCALFTDDEDANQGHFATLLKQQHLRARMSFLHSLQEGLIAVCKEENVSSLGSRQVEKVLREVGGAKERKGGMEGHEASCARMSRERLNGFLELGLGATWSSGVSEPVVNIMKGIRRGRRGGLEKSKLSNSEVVAIINNIRTKLNMEVQDEKTILERAKARAARSSDSSAGPPKNGASLTALLTRSMRNMRDAVCAETDSGGGDASEQAATARIIGRSRSSSGASGMVQRSSKSDSLMLRPNSMSRPSRDALARLAC